MSVFLWFFLIVAISVLLSSFIDNVPYIVVMLPVANHLADMSGLKPKLYMFALLIGSYVSENLTPFGASVNVAAEAFCANKGTGQILAAAQNRAAIHVAYQRDVGGIHLAVKG